MTQPARERWVNNAPAFLDKARDPGVGAVNPEALGAIQHPVLPSFGEKSPSFFPAIVSWLARVMPSANIYGYANAGHVPHVRHPTEFAQTVQGFMESVSKEIGGYSSETANAVPGCDHSGLLTVHRRQISRRMQDNCSIHRKEQ